MSLFGDRMDLQADALTSAIREDDPERALVWATVALGHAVAAIGLGLYEGNLPKTGAGEELPEPFWARVELFGHSVRYGLVSEVVFGGRRFVEVSTPEIFGIEPIEDGELLGKKSIVKPNSKRYHPNAVYAFDPRPEEEIREILYRQAGLWKHEDGDWWTTPEEGQSRAFAEVGDDLF